MYVVPNVYDLLSNDITYSYCYRHSIDKTRYSDQYEVRYVCSSCHAEKLLAKRLDDANRLKVKTMQPETRFCEKHRTKHETNT